MKKSLYYSFASSFTIWQGISLFFHCSNSRQEKKWNHMKNNLADNELEKVVVSNVDIDNGSSDFRFKDDNKEFVYKGKLYDIVRQKSDGVNTVFYCINDKNEESLIEGLEEHIQRNTDQNLPAKNNTSNLVKNIVKDALPDKQYKQICNYCSKITFNTYYNLYLKEQFIPPPTPPPKS